MKNISPHKQHGAVLIIGLILLVLMTMIGITAMQVTSIEEKMAGNTNDHNMAFQAAESALRSAEEYIDSLVTLADFIDGNAGFYDEVTQEPNYLDPSIWVNNNSVQLTSNLLGLQSDPRYIIKYVGVQGSDINSGLEVAGYGQTTAGTAVTIFRITSRGTGGNDASQVILQSYYGKRF